MYWLSPKLGCNTDPPILRTIKIKNRLFISQKAMIRQCASEKKTKENNGLSVAGMAGYKEKPS